MLGRENVVGQHGILLKEIDGLTHLHEETKEMLRRMVTTMNHEMTPTQLSEYTLQ